MEKKDEVLTTRTETNASSSSTTTPKRSSPCCARCRNHELQIPLKDHKRYCKYRYCTCRGCKDVAKRQRVMAKQTKRRRAQEQDRKKKKAVGEDDPVPFWMESDNRHSGVLEPARSFEGSNDSSSGDSTISSHGGNGVHTGLGGAITIPTSRKVTSSHPHTGAPNHLTQDQFGGSAEFLLLYTIKLMELFRCPRGMLVYMYVIVKYANGNLEEAVNRILQVCYHPKIVLWGTTLDKILSFILKLIPS